MGFFFFLVMVKQFKFECLRTLAQPAADDNIRHIISELVNSFLNMYLYSYLYVYTNIMRFC
jgi:hypothetical protein